MMQAFPRTRKQKMLPLITQPQDQKKRRPVSRTAWLRIQSCSLRMDLPHAAAEAGDAHETCIRCDVDIVYFNERQAGAKAAPTHSTVDGAINAQERSGVQRVNVHRAYRQASNRNVGQTSVHVSKREAAVG